MYEVNWVYQAMARLANQSPVVCGDRCTGDVRAAISVRHRKPSHMTTAASKELKEATAMSLVGAKVEWLDTKFSETTKSLLVVGFDPIAQLNLVMGLGTAVSRLDMVKLLKEHPSAEVSTCGPDDPILLEYSMVESSESGIRKSKCEASKKIKRLSEPQPKILDEGPPPRRRSRASRIIPSRSNSTCAICYAEDSNLVMLNPCSHATFCVTCAARLNECPVCRGIVTGTRRIFFA